MRQGRPAMLDTARLGQAGRCRWQRPDPIASTRTVGGCRRTAKPPAPTRYSAKDRAPLTATTPVEVSSQMGSASRLILAGHSHLCAIAGQHLQQLFYRPAELI